MLSKRVAKYFDPGVRSRGHTYYAGGLVKLSEDSADNQILAQVRGSAIYEVEITWKRSESMLALAVSCTCPYTAEWSDFCKHMWAVFLAADSHPAMRSLPSRVELALVDIDGVDVEDESDDDDYEPYALRRPCDRDALGGRSDRTGGRKARPGQQPPAWSRLLNELARLTVGQPPELPPAAADALIEPWYILEVPECVSYGGFVLSLAHQVRTKTGRLSKPRKLALTPEDIVRLREGLDRHICLMIVGAGDSCATYAYSAYGYRSRPSASKWGIPCRTVPTLLPLLFQTGRFYVRPDVASDPVALTWDDGAPWDLVASVLPAASKGEYVLTARLRRGGQSLGVGDATCFFRGDPGLVLRKNVLAAARFHGCFGWISHLRESGAAKVKAADREKLLAAVAGLEHCPPIEWPADWNIVEVTDLAPRPELSLSRPQPAYWHDKSLIAAEVRFRYGDAVAVPDRGSRVLVEANALRQVRRDREAEQALLRRALQLGVEHRPSSYSEYQYWLRDRRVPDVVYALMREGWTVYGDWKLFRPSGHFSINVTTGIDWFEIDGTVDFGGQTASLPELLAAARRGERFVRLGDGSMGLLPETWLAQHATLLGLGEVEDGKVRFARTQVGLIDALLAEMPEATFDANLAAAREKLRAFRGVCAMAAPEGFVGTLRPYQEQGLGWMSFLRDFQWGGCLADDMGLGKTVQVLALLLDRKRKGEAGPSLIVMPKSIVFNWLREAGHFAPELRVLDYTGLERTALRESFSQHDVVLTTYGTLRRDVDFLRKQEFHYVILDEAQNIKNPDALAAKASRLLRARQRLVMTGTPVENHLGDLWSLFEFLNPGMLGTLQAFKEAFARRPAPDQPPAQLDTLHRMLRPFILRRTKEQVAPELPTRSEQTIECVMPPKQAAYYAEMRDYYRASLLSRVARNGLARSKVYVLEALLRLRQVACHPGLVDKERRNAESAKLEVFLPMVEELADEGHKALVFSQFTSLLSILREHLDAKGVGYEYLDGQTIDRQRRVDHFQNDPACPLFLISLKAGGTGLNLTAADYVFILDPWWNPAVEAQAIDRTHRIGQDKKVIAYRLITRDTVEAKILELQAAKRGLAEAIITQANSLIQQLTREDLELLLS